MKLRLGGSDKRSGKEHEICGSNVRCNLRNNMSETKNGEQHKRRRETTLRLKNKKFFRKSRVVNLETTLQGNSCKN
jgi:hypothetical protein